MLNFPFRFTNKQRWVTIRESFNEKLNKIIATASLTNGSDFEDFEVVIRKLKKQPTSNQRAYYFAVILPAINEGMKHQGSFYADLAKLDADIRDAIKDEFGLYREEENKLTGKTYKTVISLSNAKGDRGETKKYIEAVLCWAARDYGIEVPSPYFRT